MSNIIDFMDYQSDRKSFQEDLAGSGLTVNSLQSNRSEIVMYVSDSVEQGVIVFGFGASELSKISKAESLSWAHLVQVWEIMANPELGFDATYKKNAIEYLISSLPGLESWNTLSRIMVDRNSNLTTHLFLEIDRKNIVKPSCIYITNLNQKILDDTAIAETKRIADNLA